MIALNHKFHGSFLFRGLLAVNLVDHIACVPLLQAISLNDILHGHYEWCIDLIILMLKYKRQELLDS